MDLVVLKDDAVPVFVCEIIFVSIVSRVLHGSG